MSKYNYYVKVDHKLSAWALDHPIEECISGFGDEEDVLL